MPEAQLLRLPQVEKRCGLKKSCIYKWISEGRFPRPVKLGGRSVAWRSDKIDQWINTRPYANIDIEIKAGHV